MTPIKLKDVAVDAIKNHDRLLVVGAPGIGKTDIIHQAADEAGADLLVSHPAVEDPTDPKGFPFRAAEGTHADFLPFGILYKALNAKKLTVWLLDDFGQATESVQKAYMQLLLSGGLNGHKLPKDVVFIAATNDVKQQSGVTGLIEPVKSRFDSIVKLDVTLDDWCSWAVSHGMPAELIAFLRNRPELLHKFEATKELTNSPCPRTWASVGRRVARGVQDFELLSGAVGKGAATEFIAFLETITKCPSIDAILMSPDTEAVPSEPSFRYLIATALGLRATPQNIERAMKYLYRMPQPFRVLSMKDAVNRDKKLLSTKSFISWAAQEGKGLITLALTFGLLSGILLA